MKIRSIMVFCIVFTTAAFSLFVFFFQGNLVAREKAQLNDHAFIIANSLWNFEKQSPLIYLTLASQANGYSWIVVEDDKGRPFLEIRGPALTQMDQIFRSVNLIPIYQLESNIEFDGKTIGKISAAWPSRAIYIYFYILFCIFLLLMGAWLFLKLLDSNRTLESRVQARTAELENENIERRRTEEALRQATLVVESSPAILFRWKAEKGWPVVLVSRNVSQLGYSAEELLDGSLPFASIIHPDDLGRIFREVQDNTALGLDRFQQEYRIITKHGQIRWLDDRTSVERNEEGRITHYQGIVVDITERKHAEETLRKYERIVSTSHDLMALISRDYVYEAVNESFLAVHAKSRTEVLGRQVSEVMGESAFRETIKARFDQALAGRTVHYQATFDFRGSGRRIMDVTFFPLLDKSGNVEAVVLNSRDITETKKLEEHLQIAQKMEAIGTLAGGIAHDFNNLLSVIIGNSNLLELSDNLAEEDRSHLQQVLYAGERAKQLVKQILAFSRRTEQKQVLVNLKHLVKETCDFLKSTIPSSIELRQNIRIDPEAKILGDPTQMQQVLMNLCTNAAHAMENQEMGLLEISLEKRLLTREEAQFQPDVEPGEFVQLTVADNGEGIDAAVLERIFEPYFTTKEKGRGTGLGLSVVHGIVKEHGGFIKVYSEVGRGTQFHVFFPVASKGAGETIGVLDRKLPGGTENILLVDDEKALVDMGKIMLERLGYKVDTRTSPVEAIEAFRANPEKYDAVVTDMSMPQMSGISLSKKLLEIRGNIPILLCTGFSDRTNEERAHSVGIKAFAFKPLSLIQLANTLRAILDDTGKPSSAESQAQE